MARYKELYLEQRDTINDLEYKIQEYQEKIKELEQTISELKSKEISENENTYEWFKKSFGENLHRFFKEEMCGRLEIETEKVYEEYDRYGHYESTASYNYYVPKSSRDEN